MKILSIENLYGLARYYRLVDPFGAAQQMRRALESATSREKVDDALSVVNRILEGHDVEAIHALDEQVDDYYYDIVALYVNMGDAYKPTILYETEDQRFLVTSWGEWVEWAESRRRPRYRFE